MEEDGIILNKIKQEIEEGKVKVPADLLEEKLKNVRERGEKIKKL